MLQTFILKTINVYRQLPRDIQNYYKQQFGLLSSASIMDVEQAIERMYKSNKNKAIDIAKEMDDELLE